MLSRKNLEDTIMYIRYGITLFPIKQLIYKLQNTVYNISAARSVYMYIDNMKNFFTWGGFNS